MAIWKLDSSPDLENFSAKSCSIDKVWYLHPFICPELLGERKSHFCRQSLSNCLHFLWPRWGNGKSGHWVEAAAILIVLGTCVQHFIRMICSYRKESACHRILRSSESLCQRRISLELAYLDASGGISWSHASGSPLTIHWANGYKVWTS